MTDEGVFPKVDGDILYASEVNDNFSMSQHQQIILSAASGGIVFDGLDGTSFDQFKFSFLCGTNATGSSSIGLKINEQTSYSFSWGENGTYHAEGNSSPLIFGYVGNGSPNLVSFYEGTINNKGSSAGGGFSLISLGTDQQNNKVYVAGGRVLETGAGSVTRIDLTCSTGSFLSGTTATIWGIRENI